MTTTTDSPPSTSRTTRQIGALGTAARLGVGIWFVVRAIQIGPTPLDLALGLIAGNAFFIAVLALRGWSAAPLRMTGPLSHLANIAIAITTLNVVHVPALLFYGPAMLLAAARGYGACEMFAVSNWLRRRDDQFGCPFFLPADVIDQLTARRL